MSMKTHTRFALKDDDQILPHTFADIGSKMSKFHKINFRRQCLSKLTLYSSLVNQRKSKFHFLSNHEGEVNVGFRPSVSSGH